MEKLIKAHSRYNKDLHNAEARFRKVLDEYIDFEYGLSDMAGDGWCIYAMSYDDLCENLPIMWINKKPFTLEDYKTAITI